MNPSTRKKILIGVGGVVGLVVVAGLVAPALFDANTYKPMIAAEVKRATGRELRLDGPISLSLLPSPSVTAKNVVFFNVSGAKNPHMVEIKSVTVKPSLFALLAGDVAVNSVTLVEPKIVLEINAEGKPNWEFAPSVEEAKPAAPKPASAKPISLGELNIENGTLIFSDSKAGLSLVAEKANMSASVGSPEGPFSLKGGASLNGAPMKVDLAVSAKGSNGHTMEASLMAGTGKLAFKGTLSELGANARIAGKASAQAESLSEFMATIMGFLGDAPQQPSPMLAGKFSFEANLEVSQTAFAARDFKVALGQDSGSGTVAVTLKPALAVEAKLNVPKLDLDKWLAAAKPATPAQKPATPPPASRPTAPPASPAAALPANLTLKASLEVGEVIYNKGALRNVACELDIKGGAIAVPKLTATAPGDLQLQAKSAMAGNRVTGEFSLNGPKLRETLAWLKVDQGSLPAGKLNKLSVRGKMASSGAAIEVTDAVYELDDIKGSGGVTVTLGVPMRVVANVAIDTVNLDEYLPKQTAKAGPAAPAATPAPERAAAGPSVGLKAKVNRVIYNKETIGGVDVDIALQGTTLRLNDVKVGNLAGARLALRGTVANYSGAAPRPDIAFNFEAPDASRVAKLVGASAPENLKQVSASGGIAGSVEQLTLRDVVVNAMGYSVRATGQLNLPGAAKGAPQAAVYKGSLTVNGQTVEGLVDAKLAGRPNITADLKSAGVFDVDKITGGGGGGAPARAPAAGGGSKPIDTAALRGLDASIKFAAATLVMAPMRINNADLAVALKDGLLTVSHVKGALWGGNMNLAGTVDARQPALAVDLKGDASNILLGEMLRSTQGTNIFGGVVKVTIDGKLNAAGIAIKGAGTTPDQIKSSLAGGTTLSGHVFAGADKALTTIGSAATGAVGGVIDNTLGTVLGGVTGNRQGIGAGNLLNAISLVLNRFVNHDSPIAGRIDIAQGVLTDKDLRVQGRNCTANIDTNTNLGNSTTNTTVNFVISEDTSAPYLITTIRGPTSNLSYNVVRGTAKDPPGMINTLTAPLTGGGGQQQPQQQQQQRSIIPNIPNIFGR
ncbi:MAG TPA: AsmA family protein [Reyranellaceae bacterium]|nr:AsmA family protein [Reyranellaceae bacterium]